jgi:hypothetical protein
MNHVLQTFVFALILPAAAIAAIAVHELVHKEPVREEPDRADPSVLPKKIELIPKRK